MHTATPSQTLAPRKSSRGILLIVAGGLLLAAWSIYWMLPRQISISGGLYFPKRLLIAGPHFLQGDARWANESLGNTPDSLRDVGCAVASSAMALSSLGIATDPGALNSFLQKTDGGYTAEGWSQAPPAKPEACELEPLKAAIVFC